MPDKLRAGGSFPYTLEADRDDTQNPQFALRVLSVGDNGKLNSLREDFLATKVPADRADVLQEMLTLAVAEVKDEQCDPIEEVLTERECWELINAATMGAALTPGERSAFGLQPKSTTDESANDAKAETAKAE